MENYLEENAEFCVIPQNIENITTMKLKEHDEKTLMLYNSEFDISFIKGEETEFYTGSKNGILHFISNVISYENGMLTINYPKEFEMIQRRESERIPINYEIIIKKQDGTSIKAQMSDLSVGGMKIHTNEQLLINEPYQVKFDFDNLDLDLTYTPIRIAFEDGIYITSGQLSSKNPTSKIELVQYCYNKQFEQKNRK